MSCSIKLDAELMKRQLSSAEMVFHWSMRLFQLFGMNPLNFNNHLHSLVLFYTMAHVMMLLASLPNNMKSSLNVIIDTTSELGSMLTIIVKLVAYKYQRFKLASIMREIFDDYSVVKYNNEREVRIFVDYVFKAKAFFKFIVITVIIAAMCYYSRCFIINGLGLPMITDPTTNLTRYFLPYRLRFYFPLTNFKMFIAAMLYLIPMIFISSFTMVADAGLIIALLAHLCGQLSVLSRCSFQNIAEDGNTFYHRAAVLIVKHNRLIRLSEEIDSTFSLVLLQQVIGTSFFLCMVGYNMLMNWDNRQSYTEEILMITFAAFCVMMICNLYGYCYAGQCLIDESLQLFDALYNSSWYKLQPSDMKYFVMFLNQTRHPLSISGGGFFIYSHESFLLVVKSTMAYLSVLRTVV